MKQIGLILVLAMAMLSVPVMAQGLSGDGGVDILGKDGGIFETEGSAFRFPEMHDVNFDSLTVGNDFALAARSPIGPGPVATATNNLEIKKNQDSGECACCQALDPSCPCKDCCLKANMENVKVGNRNALAFGFAAATNNVKIVTNQQ
jgi:hypothetical protein